MARRLPPLYAVIDAAMAERAGWTVEDLARAFLDGGARAVQLRAKDLASAAFLHLADTVVRLAEPSGTVVIVNDRADIARLAGAAGVHVGQDDLSPALVRRVLLPGALVGLSTHTETQIDAAIGQPLDYLAVGPVFGTQTKATGYSPVGLGLVREAAARVRESSNAGCEVVAIGGITLDTAAEVLEAGATAVAVITDLTAHGDPAARVRAYLARLGE